MRRRLIWVLMVTSGAALTSIWLCSAPNPCPPPPSGARSTSSGFDLRYPHQPSELLVRYTPALAPAEEGSREAERGRLIARLSARVSALSPRLRIHRLALSTSGDQALTEAADAIRGRPDLFAYVEPNACVYLEQPASTGDPKRPEQWALDEIHADAAWQTSDGSGVVVGVIDSGIATGHDDLGRQLWRNPCEQVSLTGSGNGTDDACEGGTGNGKIDDLNGWNFVNESGDVNDVFDHGSQMAGVIGAVHDNGVCVKGLSNAVELLALKVSESGTGHVDRVVRALDYAVEAEIHVVNASWSTDYSNALRDALVHAANAGIVVAAAAGTGGAPADLDSSPSYPCSFKLANVICVAATTMENNLQADSSWGAGTVHLGAPGAAIYSTSRNGCKSQSGPSMATPHVAGVAALIRGKCPDATIEEVVDRIVWSGPEKAGLVGKTISGKRLDAEQALVEDCL